MSGSRLSRSCAVERPEGLRGHAENAFELVAQVRFIAESQFHGDGLVGPALRDELPRKLALQFAGPLTGGLAELAFEIAFQLPQRDGAQGRHHVWLKICIPGQLLQVRYSCESSTHGSKLVVTPTGASPTRTHL